VWAIFVAKDLGARREWCLFRKDLTVTVNFCFPRFEMVFLDFIFFRGCLSRIFLVCVKIIFIKYIYTKNKLIYKR